MLSSGLAIELYFYTTSIRCGTNGATSTLSYLHGDHLGSASLSTNAGGSKVSEMRYYPYGETRSGAIATDRRYTGQRQEAGLGLYDYNARYYDPSLSRFIQADSIVPGAASGSGGGAATLGYDSNTRLTPLTVNMGEFAAQVNAENREVLQFGAFFQWNSKVRQEHNVPMEPANPQALNRYAYCLNNPLRYTDPTGHSISLAVIGIFALAGAAGSGIGYIAAQTALGNPIDPIELGVAVGVGAIAGAATPLASLAGLVGIGFGANIANEVLPAVIKGEPIDPARTAVAGGVGAVFGLAGGVLGGSSDAVEQYIARRAVQPLCEAIGPSSAAFGKDMMRQAFKEVATEGAREGWRTAFWEFFSGINSDTLTTSR